MLTSCIVEQEQSVPIQTSYVEPSATISVVEGLPTVSVYEYISSSDYNKGCPYTDSTVSNFQIDFMNIYPGRSSISEVKEILGQPKDEIVGGLETNLLYDNVEEIFLSIIVVNGIVDRINVDNINMIYPSLKDIVENYGCPDIILAIDTSEHSSGNYNAVIFCYPEIGVEFWFDFDNINLKSIPTKIGYIKQVELVKYIESFSYFLSINNPFMKPIDWNEVVN